MNSTSKQKQPWKFSEIITEASQKGISEWIAGGVLDAISEHILDVTDDGFSVKSPGGLHGRTPGVTSGEIRSLKKNGRTLQVMPNTGDTFEWIP